MLFRAFGFKPKLDEQRKVQLPDLQSFVDLTMVGGGPKGSVAFDAVHARTFAVQALTGMRAGQTGVFAYQNAAGKFRFSAKCQSVKPPQAVFALPTRIETLQLYDAGQKRASMRLDATLPAHWRFAHGGKGQGEFTRGSLTDISRTGVSLIADRELKKGTNLEVKFVVSSSGAPLLLLTEVMRASKIEASKKTSLGLRFLGLKPEEDRSIMEFINKRQAERRSRGLA